MTVVQIRITVPTITGVNVGAKGKIRWTPTLRRNVDPNTVVLPKGFDVDLVSGEARVTVAPTTINWCWKVEEGLYRVGVPNGTTRYVSVPDSEAVINYIDLQDLDPTTLEPTATPAAIWDIELSQVEERVTTLENAPPAHTHDNLDALDQVSGINTGDQDLSGFVPNTTTINNKPLSSDITLNSEDIGSVDASSLSQVATTGDYNDLSNRPTFKTVSNRSGVTIPANTLVEMHGAFGMFSIVRIADNTTADNVSGITITEILDGDEGEIQVSGTVESLDTSGIPDGAALYLGTAGSFTHIRPTAPAHIIRVGVVGVVHPVTGTCVFTLPTFEILADNVDGLDTKVTELAQDETTSLGVSLRSTYVAQADLTVTPGASVSGTNTGDQDLSGLATKGPTGLQPTVPSIGYWHHAGGVVGGITDLTLTLTRCFLLPLDIDTPAKVSGVAIRVQTAAAGAVVRVGIYGPNAEGGPGSLIAGTEYALDASTTGIKEALFDGIPVAKGRVWVAIIGQGAVSTIRGYTTGLTAPSSSNAILLPSSTLTFVGYRGTNSGGALAATSALSTSNDQTAPLVAVKVVAP